MGYDIVEDNVDIEGFVRKWGLPGVYSGTHGKMRMNVI